MDNFQSGAITEVKGSQNISYILNDDNLFFQTGYKVLKSQTKNGLVKCARLLYNGKIKLTYFTYDYKSLISILPTLDGETFLMILADLFGTILEIKNNGFLVCQNLDLSFDKVFVDQSNLTVNLIYLPINMPQMDFATFENELRVQTVKLITSNPSLKTPNVDRVCPELSNGTVSLQELHRFVCSMCKGAKRQDKGDGRSAKQPELLLSSMNAPSRLEFKVNKPEYLIGRSGSSVDGVVRYNKAISREHCKIVYKDGVYGVIDLDSTYGTFVNKSRIPPQKVCPIKGGDIVSLANSNFKVQI